VTAVGRRTFTVEVAGGSKALTVEHRGERVEVRSDR
jgi:hypothetical protein